jgi:hypothetical protein
LTQFERFAALRDLRTQVNQRHLPSILGIQPVLKQAE